MMVALHDGAHRAAELEFEANLSARYRHRLAVRDVRDAAGLWRLCWTLAWLDIKLRYRGSTLGPFWLTLSTGVMVATMGIIYPTLFGISARDYIGFLALSLVLWGFLNGVMTDACNCYTQAEGSIRSMRMPYSLYAARIVVSNFLILGHNIIVVVVVDLVLWTLPGFTALLALPGLLLWLLDGVAIGLLLGAICARFRDIPPIVASLMQMAFFVSAVIWKPEQLKQHEWLLSFNPLFTVLQVVRAPLLGQAPSLATYGSALLASALLWIVAWAMFVRVRNRIAFWV